MPASATTLLAALIKKLKDSGVLTDRNVAAAFRAVPRHLFLPGHPLPEVYQDEAIATKLQAGRPISSSSQPAMMALMLEQLGLAPGQRVLEIGAGTGYNAALMGRLVGPGGRVITIDIDDDLVEAARAHLAAAKAGNVLAVCADGGLGHPPAAPYDRIILTVGAWDITPAWLDQLKPGGRLVLPLALGTGVQKSIAFEKHAQPASGQPLLTSLSIRDCGFMRLRGDFAGPEQAVSLGPEPGLHLMTNAALPVPPETVYAWLTGSANDTATSLHVAPREVWQGLSFWLDVNEPGLCDLIAEGDLARRGPLPSLIELDGSRPVVMQLGVLKPAGLCLLWLAPAGEDQPANPERPRELRARTFGPPGREAVTASVLNHLAAWDAAGRLGSEGMRVRAYPAGAPLTAHPREIVVTKRWTTLVIDWPGAYRKR